jgi:hypothetical protein
MWLVSFAMRLAVVGHLLPAGEATAKQCRISDVGNSPDLGIFER